MQHYAGMDVSLESTSVCIVDAQGNQLSLADWIEKAEIVFVGWDRRDSEIIAFARVAPGIR